MEMHLCIDIGNTKTKLGVTSPGADASAPWAYIDSCKTLSIPKLENIIEEFTITAAVISNTRRYPEAIHSRLLELPYFLNFNRRTPLPIINEYKTPATLGKDRIAVVCAAFDLYPGEHVLVIDAGTCITMDMISEEGIYKGGSIHPGITMRFKALNNYTDKLPLVKRGETQNLVGSSTEESIRSGVQYAAVQEIEGMIRAYNVNYGELKVIISGGDSPFFVSQLKSKIFAHSNLVLTGLKKILNYNVERL